MAKRSRTAAERAEQLTRLRTRPARAQVLAAARELATAKGYESIKAGDIATAAGVSRETFYTHFADKRSCLAEATEPRLGEIESELRIAAEEEETWATPILEALEAALVERYGSRISPRGRIIETMLGLVAERGYASTRLVDVVKAARISYPSFYRHFAGKDECFAAVCDTSIARLSDRLQTTLDPGADRLAKAVALADQLSFDPSLARILAFEIDRAPRVQKNAGVSSSIERLARLLAAGESDGSEASEGKAGSTASSSLDVLFAGAFLELLRSAIASADLERFPADIASALVHLHRPRDTRQTAGHRGQQGRSQSGRSRRTSVARRPAPIRLGARPSI